MLYMQQSNFFLVFIEIMFIERMKQLAYELVLIDCRRAGVADAGPQAFGEHAEHALGHCVNSVNGPAARVAYLFYVALPKMVGYFSQQLRNMRCLVAVEYVTYTQYMVISYLRGSPSGYEKIVLDLDNVAGLWQAHRLNVFIENDLLRHLQRQVHSRSDK